MEHHPASVLGGSLAGELFLWLFYSFIIFPVGNEHNSGWGLDLGLVEPSWAYKNMSWRTGIQKKGSAPPILVDTFNCGLMIVYSKVSKDNLWYIFSRYFMEKRKAIFWLTEIKFYIACIYKQKSNVLLP